MSSPQLTLRLVMSGKKEIVTLPASATLAELFELAAEKLLLQVPLANTKKKGKAAAVQPTLELLTGFPPRPLDKSVSMTLQEAGIQSQQSITVTMQQRTTTASAAAAPSPARPPPKRAAAQKATAGFKEAIERQEQLESTATAAQKTKAKPKASTASPNKKPRFAAATTTGYRLADGQAVSPPPRRKSKSLNRKQQCIIGDGTDALDATAAFLTSASSGGRSRQARLMRSGWRQAVNNAYERNKAVSRLSAISARKFTFSLGEDGDGVADRSDAQAKTLQVTFDKGLQGRGEYTERVDYLPKAALSTALTSIHASHADALRPENMALLSPRVLWSLMYHFNDVNTGDAASTTTPSVVAAMKQLQPDLDWSFLRRRKEQLSTKARENLRQAQEAKSASAATRNGSQSASDLDEWSRAAEAIASVEQAMEDMHVIGRSNVLMPASLTGMEPWVVETPKEFDEEELKACIAAHTPVYVAKDWVRELQDKCDVHNWRELANEDAEELSEVLEIDQEVCQAWIEYAQTESVDEIIVEVCGSVEAADFLREGANSGTPRDLAAFMFTVSLLEDALTAYAEKEPENIALPSTDDLQIWCNRAYQACEQLPWLYSFSTEESQQYDARNSGDDTIGS